GDALVTYEQEPLWDRIRGKFHGEIIYPKSTILSEHTLVVIEKHIEPADQAVIRQFIDFLWSEPAQRIFVAYGFRSVLPQLEGANAEFGKIDDAFLIKDFGGWTSARPEIVDGIWKRRVVASLHP